MDAEFKRIIYKFMSIVLEYIWAESVIKEKRLFIPRHIAATYYKLAEKSINLRIKTEEQISYINRTQE